MLIFTAIFLVLFIGLQYFKTKNEPPAPPATHPAATSNTTPPPQTPTPAATSASAPAQNTVAASAENTIIVENELYRITFSNRGGQVTSWILKRYTDNEGHPLDLAIGDKPLLVLGDPVRLG